MDLDANEYLDTLMRDKIEFDSVDEILTELNVANKIKVDGRNLYCASDWQI